MEAAKRIYLIRVLEKMEKDPKFNEKLGIKNKSQMKSKGDKLC